MANLRRQLTYANVMSTIAVFLLLGGATALAAGRIGADQLKAGAVTTGKIANEAIKNGKVAENTVTGQKVKESTLAPVPSTESTAALAGTGPSAFSRVWSSSIASKALVDPGTARAVQLTAPHDGYLFAVASGDVINEGVAVYAGTDCRLNLDGVDVPASIRSVSTSSEKNPRGVCATSMIVPVTAGPHVVYFTFGGAIGFEVWIERAELDVAFAQFAG
jgi:hypothetical protein